MSESIEKVIRPGRLIANDRRVDVFCKVDYNGTRLSISGVVGPLANGNAWGGAGQIDMEFAHRNPDDNDARYTALYSTDDFVFSVLWNAEMWLDFLDVWKRWHLNDMRAECEHQRALRWTYKTHAGRNCPECGYGIGTKWLHEDVPESVLDFLRALPVTDKQPAWV